ncbi:MAG: VWA domain-containing protein [Pseudomonadales bacterium]|jgi:hypothetical protein
MSKKDQIPSANSSLLKGPEARSSAIVDTDVSTDVSQFLQKVTNTPMVNKRSGKGRLVFAMDATASREPTWDHACQLQGEMFSTTDALGGLMIQMCYYRGFREFYTSPWCLHSEELLSEMTAARCLGGHTQIHKVLSHLMEENSRQKIQAAVFVGDALEEDADKLCHQAGKLGVLGIPLFVFQEGRQANVRSVFKQMAALSGGAYSPFDLNSASQLKNLLSAVAVFAAGGKQALKKLEHQTEVLRLIEQLKES